MIKILEHSMATELRKETRRVDLAGQKWCAATASDSVTAYRLWTLFRRTQGLTGPATVSHSLVDPWALVHHGSIQTSHNDRGIPSDHTKANVVHDGVRMRTPPLLGEAVKRAVTRAALSIELTTNGKEIHGSASIHVFPRNAWKMNIFGEVDETMHAIRIIALSPRKCFHTRGQS